MGSPVNSENVGNMSQNAEICLLTLPASIVPGQWKAVVKDRRKGLDLELYDIEKDEAEQFDLSRQHPEVTVKIQNMMQKAHVKNPFWDKSFSPLFNTEAAAELNGVKPDPNRFYNRKKKKQ